MVAFWVAEIKSLGEHTLPPQSGELSGAVATTTGRGFLYIEVAAESFSTIGVARTLFALGEASRMADHICCIVARLRSWKGRIRTNFPISMRRGENDNRNSTSRSESKDSQRDECSAFLSSLKF